MQRGTERRGRYMSPRGNLHAYPEGGRGAASGWHKGGRSYGVSTTPLPKSALQYYLTVSKPASRPPWLSASSYPLSVLSPSPQTLLEAQVLLSNWLKLLRRCCRVYARPPLSLRGCRGETTCTTSGLTRQVGAPACPVVGEPTDLMCLPG